MGPDCSEKSYQDIWWLGYGGEGLWRKYRFQVWPIGWMVVLLSKKRMLKENLLLWEDHHSKNYSCVPLVAWLSPRRLTCAEYLNRSHIFWMSFVNDQGDTGQQGTKVRLFIPPVHCSLFISFYSVCILVKSSFNIFFC